jgi:hypothetical protein
MRTRIELTDNVVSMVTKMSDGNPGAITAMMEIMKINKTVDPDSFLGEIGSILSLDSMGIYGTDIYVLWSDICERDTVSMISVLRACQMGFISEDVIKDASGRQDRSGVEMIDRNDLYKKVCEALPNFDIENRE